MGPIAAPWRVTATAMSRANASVKMPLLEEDVPQIIHRPARVEEMRGKCVKNYRIQLAKRKQDDILQAQRQKEEAKRAEAVWVLHPYPLPSLWRSSPGWLRNFPGLITASRFPWDFCKIP